jgi:hypothetical protein
LGDSSEGLPHELSDGLQDADDGFIMRLELALELIELRCKFSVRGEQPAHPNEGAHDLSIGRDRSCAS